MPVAELALAIDACITETTPIVIKIIQTAIEVVRHKKKCMNLGAEAKRLENLLKDKKANLKTLDTVKELVLLIHEIDGFVVLAKTWTIFGAAWDTIFKHSYQGFIKRAARIKHELIFEASITSQSEIVNLRRGQNRLVKLMESMGDRLNETIQSNEAGHGFSHLPWSKLPEDLKLGDTDLQNLTIDEENEISSALIEGIGKVALRSLLKTNATIGYLRTYRDIQAAAYVETFYGVYETPDVAYAVLQDLSGAPTLAQVLADGTLPSNVKDRLNLCCDLAQSVAWFHQNNIQIKSISDTTILLNNVDGPTTRPILTGLESSRLFLERTARSIYDIRYEAPEYPELGKHTPYTDLWSLGIALWQLYTGKTPFDSKSPVLSNSDEATTIHEHLAKGDLPGALDSVDIPAFASVIQQCWDRNPLIRGSATDIATMILDIRLGNVGQDVETESRDMPMDSPSPANQPIQNDKTAQNDTSMMETAEVSKFEATLLEYIQDARLRYENEDDSAPAEKISSEEFHKYVDATAWGGTKFFLVGAAILWNLVEGELASLRTSEAFPILEVSRTDKERRARLALSYLEPAIDSGYNEAFRESYIAHSTIAWEMQAKSDAWLPDIPSK